MDLDWKERRRGYNPKQLWVTLGERPVRDKWAYLLDIRNQGVYVTDEVPELFRCPGFKLADVPVRKRLLFVPRTKVEVDKGAGLTNVVHAAKQSFRASYCHPEAGIALLQQVKEKPCTFFVPTTVQFPPDRDTGLCDTGVLVVTVDDSGQKILDALRVSGQMPFEFDDVLLALQAE